MSKYPPLYVMSVERINLSVSHPLNGLLVLRRHLDHSWLIKISFPCLSLLSCLTLVDHPDECLLILTGNRMVLKPEAESPCKDLDKIAPKNLLLSCAKNVKKMQRIFATFQAMSVYLWDDAEKLWVAATNLLEHCGQHVGILLDHRPGHTFISSSVSYIRVYLICANISWSLRKARGFPAPGAPAGAAGWPDAGAAGAAGWPVIGWLGIMSLVDHY